MIAKTMSDADRVNYWQNEYAGLRHQHQQAQQLTTRLTEALREIQEYRETCMICANGKNDSELDVEYRKGARAVLDNVSKMAALALAAVAKERAL